MENEFRNGFGWVRTVYCVLEVDNFRYRTCTNGMEERIYINAYDKEEICEGKEGN